MRYRFGDCHLCTETYELHRAGKPVHVEPQVFDLLCLLLARPGALVGHDELIAEIWQGRIVSDAAISARISAARAAIGDDGTRQDWIRTVPRRGFRFVGNVACEGGPSPRDPPAGQEPSPRQQIGFCHAPDGTRIAYARSGAGPPMVRAGHWLTHLQHDWESPVWRPVLDAFGQHFTLWRHDQRGNGLSEVDPDDLSLDALVGDLAAVVDAAGLTRFALYGISQGAPVAVRYAIRHPDRVTHLILQGGFARGRRRRGDPGEVALSEAMVTMIRQGWGRTGSAYVRAFASMFMPDGTTEQVRSLADLQRICTPTRSAWRLREAVDGYSVADELADVRVPALVLHARGDAVHPLSEGLALAAGIPGAQFVMLESANHVVTPQEPAWTALLSEIRRFVSTGQAGL